MGLSSGRKKARRGGPYGTLVAVGRAVRTKAAGRTGRVLAIDVVGMGRASCPGQDGGDGEGGSEDNFTHGNSRSGAGWMLCSVRQSEQGEDQSFRILLFKTLKTEEIMATVSTTSRVIAARP